MGDRTWRHVLIAALACGSVVSPTIADAQGRMGGSNRPSVRAQDHYDRGYRQGVRQGELDARSGVRYDARRDAALRANARDAYGAGFADGYRAGYERIYVLTAQRGRPGGRGNRGLGLGGARVLVPDPYARGYARGYEQGLSDGRDGDRYDPVRHRNYRDGDEGYSNDHGSRDAYRNNYRAGFRQGYEEGYRLGTRNRRR